MDEFHNPAISPSTDGRSLETTCVSLLSDYNWFCGMSREVKMENCSLKSELSVRETQSHIINLARANRTLDHGHLSIYVIHFAGHSFPYFILWWLHKGKKQKNHANWLCECALKCSACITNRNVKCLCSPTKYNKHSLSRTHVHTHKSYTNYFTQCSHYSIYSTTHTQAHIENLFHTHTPHTHTASVTSSSGDSQRR